ncbi:MAG: TonB-dependent receptor, partial [Ignavibacteria bacterium]|nr:TonB-dependent receptor [Ignavibacteria bacterium]
WKHIFSPKVFANFWVTRSTFDSEFKIDKLFKLDEINKLYDYTIKASLEYYLSNEFALRFGAEHKIMRFQYKEDTKDMLVDIDQKCQLSTTYINTQWRPDNLVDVDFGIRVNYFHGDDNYTNFEPRFQTKYRLTENSSVKFATGLYYQYLNRIPRLFFASIWSAVDKTTKPSSSEHFILSYQRELSDFLELEADVYYKTYKNLYIFNQNLSTDITPGYHTAEGYPVYNSTRDVFVRGDGHSFGFEIMARKEAGAVNGWIAYSYSKTLNTFDGINQGQEYAPRHDRASVVNMVLNGNLGNLFNGKWDEKPEKQSSQWLFGLNFIYASGQPITMPGSAYYINSLPDGYNNVIPSENMPGYKLYPQSINSYRLPAYTRMDLSITYEKNYGSWSLAPYLQIFNIGNRKNLWFIQYKDEAKDGKIVQKIEKMQMLPMLPSIGITVKF